MINKTVKYKAFLRDRITELRAREGISEHRLSLELSKSGSYIRSITSGATLSSIKELFDIMSYIHISPSEFFVGLEDQNSLRVVLSKKFRDLDDADLEKVSLFISWIQK